MILLVTKCAFRSFVGVVVVQVFERVHMPQLKPLKHLPNCSANGCFVDVECWEDDVNGT